MQLSTEGFGLQKTNIIGVEIRMFHIWVNVAATPYTAGRTEQLILICQGIAPNWRLAKSFSSLDQTIPVPAELMDVLADPNRAVFLDFKNQRIEAAVVPAVAKKEPAAPAAADAQPTARFKQE